MGNWLALFCSSAGFAGFVPGWLSRKWCDKGGGTMGSLVALAPFALCLKDPNGLYWQVGLIAASFIVGLVVITPAEILMLEWGPGRGKDGSDVVLDRNQTCIDEVHGQLIAGLPVYWLAESSMHAAILVATSFALFRLFDGVKVGPVKWADESVPGSLGIMLDDTFAGLMAAAALVYLVPFA